MTFAPPEIQWPRETRGVSRFNEALMIGNALGDEAGLAYIYAALIFELELSNRREGSPLHEAVEDFMIALGKLAQS